MIPVFNIGVLGEQMASYRMRFGGTRNPPNMPVIAAPVRTATASGPVQVPLMVAPPPAAASSARTTPAAQSGLHTVPTVLTVPTTVATPALTSSDADASVKI